MPTQTSMPMQTSVPTQTFRFAVIANASPAFQYVASTVLGGGRGLLHNIYIYIYIYGVRAHQRPKETIPVLSEPENGTANVKVLQMAVR